MSDLSGWISEEQAIAMSKSGWWRGKSARDICRFQLFEDRLCMDFSAFHEAVEKALGRPVYTHEFGTQGIAQLRKEFLGEAEAPTLQEILGMIPEANRIVIRTETP